MHRVFYRYFFEKRLPAVYQQITFGLLNGIMLGSLLFISLNSSLDFKQTVVLWENSQNFFSVLLCGLLPVILAGVFFFIGAKELVRMLVPALSAWTMVFSSLCLCFSGCCGLLNVLLVLSGRIAGLVWLYLFLIRETGNDFGRLFFSFLLTVLLTAVTLAFFHWLTEPCLQALSIYTFK